MPEYRLNPDITLTMFITLDEFLKTHHVSSPDPDGLMVVHHDHEAIVFWPRKDGAHWKEYRDYHRYRYLGGDVRKARIGFADVVQRSGGVVAEDMLPLTPAGPYVPPQDSLRLPARGGGA